MGFDCLWLKYRQWWQDNIFWDAKIAKFNNIEVCHQIKYKAVPCDVAHRHERRGDSQCQKNEDGDVLHFNYWMIIWYKEQRRLAICNSIAVEIDTVVVLSFCSSRVTFWCNTHTAFQDRRTSKKNEWSMDIFRDVALTAVSEKYDFCHFMWHVLHTYHYKYTHVTAAVNVGTYWVSTDVTKKAHEILEILQLDAGTVAHGVICSPRVYPTGKYLISGVKIFDCAKNNTKQSCNYCVYVPPMLIHWQRVPL